MFMEYPNRNLQYVMQKEADRALRDYEMFGVDALQLYAPDKRFMSRFTFKNLSQNIGSTFTHK